jgi:NAD-dependent deacetylase
LSKDEFVAQHFAAVIPRPGWHSTRLEPMPATPTLATVAAWLFQARAVVSFSGAGLSKASGIPTYRDTGGLWTVQGNLRFSSADAWREDPTGFHDFWEARRAQLALAEPNAAHRALAALDRRVADVQHITQNVDGLLARAGCAVVHELHGSLARWRCEACDGAPFPAQTRCPACGALARPDVVMFGEMLPAGTFAAAELAVKRSEVCLVVGTTAVVYPAAALVEKARARGSKIVVINVEPSEIDDTADAVLRGKAEEILPALMAAMA